MNVDLLPGKVLSQLNLCRNQWCIISKPTTSHLASMRDSLRQCREGSISVQPATLQQVKDVAGDVRGLGLYGWLHDDDVNSIVAPSNLNGHWFNR